MSLDHALQELLDGHGRTETLDELDHVQSGQVILPLAIGRSSQDRFADFNARLVGSGDLLLDDGRVWAHLRRRPA